jgi:hypothetical protein
VEQQRLQQLLEFPVLTSLYQQAFQLLLTHIQLQLQLLMLLVLDQLLLLRQLPHTLLQ